MIKWLLQLFKRFKQEKKMILTLQQLLKINSNLNKKECEYYLTAFNELLPKFDINTNLRISHFLAQVLHESGHLKYKEENLNYSAEGLRKVFPKYFPTDGLAKEYARKPEKIANRVYANRMGNGDEKSGDGAHFLGRGLIQLTGRANYSKCGKELSMDLLNNPKCIVESANNCLITACWFWKDKGLNEYADKNDINTITKLINGGLNGISDRIKIFNLAKEVLKQ